MLTSLVCRRAAAQHIFSNQCKRNFALSRFPNGRPTGTGRIRSNVRPKASSQHEGKKDQTQETTGQDFFQEGAARAAGSTLDTEAGLDRLLLTRDTLVIERQLEMLNVFIGFEQCNKYSISSIDGEPLGYITEAPGTFFSSLSRQVFRTHRPFRALIMDVHGAPLLWLRRPFSWVNSRMYVQQQVDLTGEQEPVLETFAEVQQVWHPLRRKYDLFTRDKPRRILSLATDPEQPDPEPEEVFKQLAEVDAGFLAWEFGLKSDKGDEIAFVSRSFRGFGRELFTDTGRYSVHFGPRPTLEVNLDGTITQRQQPTQNLSREERAVSLALAVNIDFDYFSRHSSGPGGFMHFGSFD